MVPKKQVDHFDELDDESYQALFETVKKLSTHVKTIMRKKRAVINILGFDVPHAHVHIMPADTATEFKQAVVRSDETDVTEPDHAALAEIAKKLSMLE